MPYPIRSKQWPPYPRIPIFLETSDSNGTTRSFNTISPIPPCPEVRPQGSVVRALAAASTQLTSISPASPATQFTNLSPIWPIPEPPPDVVQQPPKRPALRFFPSQRPRLQLEEISLNETRKLQQRNVDPSGKSKLGLGIQHAPSNVIPEPVLSPGLAAAKEKRSSNIAQRIEEGLWRYSLSGNVIKRWLLEIISWWISAICMATIVGVLAFYQNKRIPNWPGSLTLNALIAILSKVSGAALILPVSEALGQLKWSWFQGHSKKMWDFEIFDNASRGPWGSFLLLIRTKGRALAALGAVITLFSLALDPFFQQVVDFPDRLALQGESSIPRIIHYAPRYLPELRAGAPVSQQDPDILPVASKFFYENGTQPLKLGNGTRPDIPINCPTGNCTWPEYNTLGVCSRCADVTQLLTFACLESRVDWLANLTGAGTESTYPNGTMCGWFFNATSKSDPPVMMSGYLTESVQSVAGGALKGEVLLTRLLPLTTGASTTSPSRQPLFGGSIRFKDVRNPLLNAVIVSAANGAESVYRNYTPIAHECLLSWCVKTIKSAYLSGAYEEEVINTYENDTTGSFAWISEPFITPTLNGTNVFYRDNITVNAPLTANGSDSVQYGLSNSTFQKIYGVFDDAFPAVYTAANSSATPILRYKMRMTGASFQRVLDFNPWSGSNNVSSHMERMAAAYTNVMRSNANVANMSSVNGDARSWETFVSVRWQWLTLPLSLLFLSLAFLLATMRKTAKEGVWKTSAIATLLYGLPDAMQEEITRSSSSSKGTPRAQAKKLKVRLHPGTGWRVSGANLFSPLTPKARQYQPPPGWI